jgi:hypothetical protein
VVTRRGLWTTRSHPARDTLSTEIAKSTRERTGAGFMLYSAQIG